MFGCSNPPICTEASNLIKPGKFKSPRFGCKASPTLVSVITRNIGNLQSQGNTQQSKSPIVKENKDNLKKKHRENLHEIKLSSLRESKERGTTSKRLDANQPLPSAISKSHQSKGNKLQQPAALPEINHNLKDTKNQHKQFHKENRMEADKDEAAKKKIKQYHKPQTNQ